MAKVKLAIRIRPFTEKELKSDKDRVAVVCVSGENTVTITNIKVNTSGAGDSRERVRPYNADFAFDSSCNDTNKEYATQEKIFESIGGGVLASISQGLSACVLAYGQSATGKTYTMMGSESNPGLIPRLCRALGEEQPIDIKVSFLEIYNERVHDLLAGDVTPTVDTFDTFSSLPRRKGNARKDLRVREHPTKGPYVQRGEAIAISGTDSKLQIKYFVLLPPVRLLCTTDFDIGPILLFKDILEELVPYMASDSPLMTLWYEKHMAKWGCTSCISAYLFGEYRHLRRVCVRDVGALLSLVYEGARRRRTAATRRNPASSRSHALLQLTTPRATLHLADLAGSEKASWEGCGGGRQKEGANINKSLVALSNVISALVNGGSGRSKFVPYRDSSLTWLLKDCFTGGGSIFIIATVSPSAACYGESASTLRWAAQARRLQTPKAAPAAGITTRTALQAQLNQLLSELSRHHIRYIPESGQIAYDDDHWSLANNKNIKNDKTEEAKIGNIMNTTHPNTDARNSQSTNSFLASGSLDVTNTLDNKTKVDNEIHKEVDKLFGPILERTQSGSVLEITPLRHKKRQYCSQEVLPLNESLHQENTERLSDVSQNQCERKDVQYESTNKNSPVSILYDNQRAEIIASVTERLYSKFKKDAVANKAETQDKKMMPPLSELKICSNARQRLLELSQKAIRNKKRIGIPAHTQTRRVVIRVKDQGINAQTDLAPFIIFKNDTKIFYKDVATETFPMTPRYKDVGSGDGYLNFHDKSTTMESRKIFKKSTAMTTDVILKSNVYTQTKMLPHPRARKKAPVYTKLHKKRRDSKKTIMENCVTPSVININISPICSFDSDSISSNERSENESAENNSENSVIRPDLLISHNTDTNTEAKINVTEDVNEEKTSGVNNEIEPTAQDFDNIALEDFSDEDFPLPRVTVDTTKKFDRNDIKNLILGRNVNEYPYNIAISPNKKKETKKVIKFKDSTCDNLKTNNINSTNIRKCCNNKIDFLDPLSDTSDSTKLGSDLFIWNKCDTRYCTKAPPNRLFTSPSPNHYESVHKNKNYKSRDAGVCNDCLDGDNDVDLNNDSSSASEQNSISKSGKYWTWQNGKQIKKLSAKKRSIIKDDFENINSKIVETCNGLDNAASKYERYLDKYNKDHSTRSPTEYLQYLVNLRREVVKESLSTCSTDTISSDGHDFYTF